MPRGTGLDAGESRQARRKTRPPNWGKDDFVEARQPKAWTTAKIVGTARRELNKLAQGRADEYKRIGKFADFQKLWVTTGIAHLVKGKVRVGVFDGWQHETGPVNTRALFVATDGSGLKDGRAGYGCVGRWLGPGDDPAVAPRCFTKELSNNQWVHTTSASAAEPARPRWPPAQEGTRDTALHTYAS